MIIASAPAQSTNRSRPSNRTRWAGVAVFMLPAVTALGMVTQGVYRGGKRTNVFVEARNDLASARAILPFTPRLPSTAPAGSTLIRVLLDEPDEKRGPSIYAMDLIYTIAGDKPNAGRFVRVWQTNDVYLKKRLADPTYDRSDVQRVSGAEWFRKDGLNEDRDPGVSYSRRYDDGVTIAVSGPDERMVLGTIESLVETP